MMLSFVQNCFAHGVGKLGKEYCFSNLSAHP